MSKIAGHRWLKLPLVHRMLVLMGIRFLYRSIRQVVLFVKYGNVKEIHIEGLKLLYDTKDEVSKRFFNDAYWFGELLEKEVTLHMIDAVKQCKCFIDIGANIGFYSILAARLTEKIGGVVHSIEMDLDNLNRLKKTIELNNLSNVMTHHLAMGDQNGTTEYFLRGSEVNTLMAEGKDLTCKKAAVGMSTLDAFVRKNDLAPDVIKIDVEGAEFLVLSGMRELLLKKPLKIYCEVHLHRGSGSIFSFGHTAHDVFSAFKNNGFTVKLLRLRPDSGYSEKIINSAEEITESSMLFAYKNT